ncbi:MAG: hypothetical protein ACXWV0_04160 [Flavisolibacter sp.]
MTRVKSWLLMVVVSAGLGFTSCKNKSKETPKVTVDTNNMINTGPVVISADAELERGVRDAIKDHPGVSATVTDGVINLSGSLERNNWMKLKPALDGLSPKRVNADNLTIK